MICSSGSISFPWYLLPSFNEFVQPVCLLETELLCSSGCVFRGGKAVILCSLGTCPQWAGRRWSKSLIEIRLLCSRQSDAPKYLPLLGDSLPFLLVRILYFSEFVSDLFLFSNNQYNYRSLIRTDNEGIKPVSVWIHWSNEYPYFSESCCL